MVNPHAPSVYPIQWKGLLRGCFVFSEIDFSFRKWAGLTIGICNLCGFRREVVHFLCVKIQADRTLCICFIAGYRVPIPCVQLHLHWVLPNRWRAPSPPHARSILSSFYFQNCYPCVEPRVSFRKFILQAILWSLDSTGRSHLWVQDWYAAFRPFRSHNHRNGRSLKGFDTTLHTLVTIIFHPRD